MSEDNTMCGIFATADPIKLENLFNLNYKRGQRGFSQNGFSFFDGNSLVWEARNESKRLEIDPKFLSDFNICHVVAPTGESHFHPAIREAQEHESEGFTALWHNGILKADTISEYARTDAEAEWDTQLLVNRLHYLNTPEETSEFLSSLEGSFACLLIKDSQLFVFRNNLVPLYWDNLMNFSSVKFSFSNLLAPGVVFHVDFEQRKLVDTGIHFTTKNDPYNLG